MLIFLAFSFNFYIFFSTFVLMRKKLSDELPKSPKLSSGTWLRILPDSGDGYRLYDPLEGTAMGRLLFDKDDNWIYDGDLLGVGEQEEAAGAISGYQKEMDELFNSLKRY
jgi:hypothetical protein